MGLVCKVKNPVDTLVVNNGIRRIFPKGQDQISIARIQTCNKQTLEFEQLKGKFQLHVWS